MATYYPPVGFHFIVELEPSIKASKLATLKGIVGSADGTVPFIRAQEVKGLSASVNFEDLAEGGLNTFTHRLPTQMKYEKLTISRGVVVGSQFIEWVKAAVQDFIFEPRNLRVILLDNDHLPIDYWYFVNAVPSKLAVSDLNAQDGKVLIETVEFSYQYFTRGDKTLGALALGKQVISQVSKLTGKIKK